VNQDVATSEPHKTRLNHKHSRPTARITYPYENTEAKIHCSPILTQSSADDNRKLHAQTRRHTSIRLQVLPLTTRSRYATHSRPISSEQSLEPLRTLQSACDTAAHSHPASESQSTCPESRRPPRLCGRQCVRSRSRQWRVARSLWRRRRIDRRRRYGASKPRGSDAICPCAGDTTTST